MNTKPNPTIDARQCRSRIFLISLALFVVSVTAFSAETNIFFRTLPQNTNCFVRTFPTEGGVLVNLPDPHSKLKLSKHISFDETQKWQVVGLLDDFIDLGRKLEERNMK